MMRTRPLRFDRVKKFDWIMLFGSSLINDAISAVGDAARVWQNIQNSHIDALGSLIRWRYDASVRPEN